MKPEVVAVKCARGPTYGIRTPCRLVSVGVDVMRLSLDPESRVAFPPLIPRSIPLPIVPLPLSLPRALSVFLSFSSFLASRRASSRDGAHRLARIKYSQEF